MPRSLDSGMEVHAPDESLLPHVPDTVVPGTCLGFRAHSSHQAHAPDDSLLPHAPGTLLLDQVNDVFGHVGAQLRRATAGAGERENPY